MLLCSCEAHVLYQVNMRQYVHVFELYVPVGWECTIYHLPYSWNLTFSKAIVSRLQSQMIPQYLASLTDSITLTAIIYFNSGGKWIWRLWPLEDSAKSKEELCVFKTFWFMSIVLSYTLFAVRFTFSGLCIVYFFTIVELSWKCLQC